MANRNIIETGAGTVGTILPIQYQDGYLTADQVKVISDALITLATALNGKLSFGTGERSTRGGNFHAQWVIHTFASAGVDFEIPHGLRRKPVDVWVGIPDAPCRIYSTKRGSWNDKSIWLACNASGITVPLLIF